MSFVGRRAAAGLLVALALAAVFGCGSTDCIDMACGPPSVEIQFEPAITAAGIYRVEIEADGVRSTCEVDFRPGDGFSGASACGSLILRGGISRDYATEILGYALPESRNVAIAVFRDGQPWVEHRFEPRYRGVELRGEGCGKCSVAREEIELP